LLYLPPSSAALKLAYYACGHEDLAAKISDRLKGTLKKCNIKRMVHETGGGRTGINGREYRNDFLPRLFK